jgi:hypothetical protein
MVGDKEKQILEKIKKYIDVNDRLGKKKEIQKQFKTFFDSQVVLHEVIDPIEEDNSDADMAFDI